MTRSELPDCFQHSLMNSTWGDRHLRALTYLAQNDYASPAAIGRAAAGGLRTDGVPLDRLGAAKHGGRIAHDLMRLGFATHAQPYKDAGSYYKATDKGAELVAKGMLRYAVEHLEGAGT